MRDGNAFITPMPNAVFLPKKKKEKPMKMPTIDGLIKALSILPPKIRKSKLEIIDTDGELTNKLKSFIQISINDIGLPEQNNED